MRRILCACILLCLSIVSFAQMNKADSLYKEKKRHEIGWDYSVPDFNVNSIDEAKLGLRNAAILHSLEKNYRQAVYNTVLTRILLEQKGLPTYIQLDVSKLKVMNVAKQGSEIVITIKAWLEPKNLVGKNTDITFRFVDGLSDNDQTNYLFGSIGRYVQAKENYDDLQLSIL